jgi:hypothetical protein
MVPPWPEGSLLPSRGFLLHTRRRPFPATSSKVRPTQTEGRNGNVNEYEILLLLDPDLDDDRQGEVVTRARELVGPA